jgi:hypothetical protein
MAIKGINSPVRISEIQDGRYSGELLRKNQYLFFWVV